jgi:ethanolamine utilization microcompartment shell protein EutL
MVLGGQAERIELALVVLQLHRALSVGVVGLVRETSGGARSLSKSGGEIIGLLGGEREHGVVEVCARSLQDFAQHIVLIYYYN